MADRAPVDGDEPGPSGMWARALAAAHDRIRPAIAKDRHEHTVGLFERFESEVAPQIGPIIDRLVASGAVPDDLRPLFDQLRDPTHFSAGVLLGFGVGATIYPALSAALAPAIQEISNAVWPLNPSVPLSPALLADAVLKGYRDEGDAATQAGLSGIDAHRFSLMVDATGEPISIEQALLLYRRGQLDAGRLEHAVRQSRVKIEWMQDILNLRFAPPPPGEVIAAALKGHLDDGTAQTKLGEAGIDPANYQWMKDSAGRPPGVMEMVALWNRGYIDQARVEQAVRQSDVNTDYVGDVLNLRWYHVPPRSIVAMLRAGGIDSARASQLLTEAGVRPDDQQAFLNEATTGRQSSVRELSVSQITGLYELRMIDAATATARLTAIGWHADDVTLLLQLADERRRQAIVGRAVTKIGTLYVGWKIDKPTASGDLSQAGVPPDAAADLFASWDIERASNVHHPTVAQVLGAYRRGQISAAETKLRLEQNGVQPGDLAIIVADAYPPTHPDPSAVAAVVNA